MEWSKGKVGLWDADMELKTGVGCTDERVTDMRMVKVNVEKWLGISVTVDLWMGLQVRNPSFGIHVARTWRGFGSEIGASEIWWLGKKTRSQNGFACKGKHTTHLLAGGKGLTHLVSLLLPGSTSTVYVWNFSRLLHAFSKCLGWFQQTAPSILRQDLR